MKNKLKCPICKSDMKIETIYKDEISRSLNRVYSRDSIKMTVAENIEIKYRCVECNSFLQTKTMEQYEGMVEGDEDRKVRIENKANERICGK